MASSFSGAFLEDNLQTVTQQVPISYRVVSSSSSSESSLSLSVRQGPVFARDLRIRFGVLFYQR